ncbi:MAG: DedA family protein [Gammaproteobacteria bacterium]|jgi:membrane-associated protein|nr:DedA family protein [Gammaproteobacteria bacterium]
MELLTYLIDLFLHLDRHLVELIQQYGPWIYLILFLVIFAETGLVVTPFLPGDSLLFVAGTLAAAGGMDVGLLIVLLCIAAILGDSVNYAIGKHAGERLVRHGRLIRPEHVARTHAFFDKYGGKTIVIARFVPIVRTFAPFVAGIGKMTYGRFLFFNVTGGILWVVSLTLAGYYFGNLPIVKDNLSLVIIGIIVASIMPAVIEYLRHRREAARARTGS